MRITGGELGGRRLKMPSAGHVRPTQDAVREAVFSMLMDVVPGSSFLDLFAGSGSIGIEAWSRGAKQVTWVERDPKVARILKENIETLCGAEAAKIIGEDVLTWLARPALQPGTIDVVYADPPYATEENPDVIEAVIDRLTASGWLAPRAIFVAEQATGGPYPSPAGWERIRERRYGHTRILIFRKNAGGLIANGP